MIWDDLGDGLRWQACSELGLRGGGRRCGAGLAWTRGGLPQQVDCTLSFPSCGLMIRANYIPLAPQESCLINSLKPQDTEIYLAAPQKSRNSLASEDDKNLLTGLVTLDASPFPDWHLGPIPVLLRSPVPREHERQNPSFIALEGSSTTGRWSAAPHIQPRKIPT